MEWLSQWTFWLIVVLVVLVTLLIVGLVVVSHHLNRLHILINERDRILQAQLTDELSRARLDLEQKITLKNRELHSELTAMSMAMTALTSISHNEDDSSVGNVEEEKVEVPLKITSEQCFKSLSTLFIRNEQRLAAVEGGVSITTANKWLDTWEQNGWITKVSRGKYMKTLKGKKFSLIVH